MMYLRSEQRGDGDSEVFNNGHLFLGEKFSNIIFMWAQDGLNAKQSLLFIL